MIDHIELYVASLFREAPQKRRVIELREELLSNMCDKYSDLVAQGRSPQEAYQEVLAGIGDVPGLIADISQGSLTDGAENKKRAMLLYALGGGLMISAILLFFLLIGLHLDVPGTILSVIMLGLGVGCLIYASGLNIPEPYQKEDDSFVEEYKEKYSQPSRNVRLRGAATGLLWMLITLCYFAFSFWSGRWNITWVIFLVGAVLQQVVNAVFSDKKRMVTTGMIFSTTVILYLILSFGTGKWAYTWLIFLGAAAVDQVIRFARIWREP